MNSIEIRNAFVLALSLTFDKPKGMVRSNRYLQKGSRIVLEWDNAKATKVLVHEPQQKGQKWYGEVIRHDQNEFLATGTDFCIYITKPERADDRKIYPDLLKLRNDQLDLADIEVLYDAEAASRELYAKKLFTKTNVMGYLMHYAKPLYPIRRGASFQ